MQPQPTCPICSARSRRRLGLRADRTIPELLHGETSATTVEVVVCRSCRHVWADPVPDAETLVRLYQRDEAAYFDHLESYDVGTMEVLSRWAPTGRLLDVGCGGGRLLQAGRAAGWEVEGIEPTPEFARRASEFGPVHVGYLDEKFTGSGYSAITLMAVLEHVPDPLGVLRRAHDVTRSGAVLLAEVPNAHRPEAWLMDKLLRLRGQPWTVRTAPMQSPFHLSEFSRASLTLALETTGWEVLDLDVTAGTNPYPVPRPVGIAVRTVERIGGRFGAGLNMTVVARRAE